MEISTSFSQFTLFSQLPVELRREVFLIAALSLPRRTIEICRPSQYNNPNLQPKHLRNIALKLASTSPPTAVPFPPLMHVCSLARAVCLEIYKPCQRSSFGTHSSPPLGYEEFKDYRDPPICVFDPAKDTLYWPVTHSRTRVFVSPPLPPPSAEQRAQTGNQLACHALRMISRIPGDFEDIVSLAFNYNPDKEMRPQMDHVIQEVKKFKSLRELILVPFEERTSCDVSTCEGYKVLKDEVILLPDPVELRLLSNAERMVPWLHQSLSQRIASQRDAVLNNFLSETQSWKTAFQNAGVEAVNGWKAPAIEFRVARRGISDTTGGRI